MYSNQGEILYFPRPIIYREDTMIISPQFKATKFFNNSFFQLCNA